MNKYLGVLGLTISLVISAGNVFAGVITQSNTFNFSSVTVSGSGLLPIATSGDLSATVSPFDGALGALDSFSIAWDIDLLAEFTTGFAGSSNGSAGSDEFGGSYFLDGISYNGGGGGDGTGGPAGMPLSILVTVATLNTFLVSDAGTLYDPQLLASVLGGSDFDLLWDTGASVAYNDVTNITGTVTGSVVITYNFNGIPEPSTMGLFFIGMIGLCATRYKRPHLSR